MEICVTGLGLIGGSICLALKRAGYKVSGWNRSDYPVSYALANGIIDEAATSFENFDVVFVALPPEPCVEFILENKFKDGAVISDICGVKKYISDKVNLKGKGYKYVGCHPMAGKEVSGIENSCANLFDRASMVITADANTDTEALNLIKGLTEDMGFAKIVECSPQVHDRKIAYTSQLAHVVSNAYVKDDEISSCIGFTGGSFQDMTRIAGVDEGVWASLYLLNGENISNKIEGLVSSLKEIKAAIDCGDKTRLQSVLKVGRERFSSGKDLKPDGEIKVTALKKL